MTGISAGVFADRAVEGPRARFRATLDAERDAVTIPEGKTELVYLVATKDGVEVGYARLFNDKRWRLDTTVRVAARDGASLVITASR